MLTTIEKVLFLQRIPLLRDLPTEALAHVASLAHEERVEAGAELWQNGDPADEIYFILSGEIGLDHPTHAEPLVIGPDCDLGASALLGGTMLHDTSALAVKPARLLRISRDEFMEVLAEHPEIARAVLDVIGTRLGSEAHRLDAWGYGGENVHRTP